MWDEINMTAEVGEDALIWMAREVTSAWPQLAALTYPKQLRIPPGYYSPEVFAASAFTGAEFIMSGRSPDVDVSTTSLHLISSRLIQYGVPTFFPTEELCDALLHTDPPEEMMLSEIKWPFPALLFMLPKAFSERYVGRVVPHIAAGYFPAHWRCRSPLKLNGVTIRDIELNHPHDIAVFVSTVMEHGSPVHYDARAVVAEREVKSFFPKNLDYYQLARFRPGTDETRKADLEVSHKCVALGINLLLAMTAEPELITRECILRPAKKDPHGKKVIRRALWRPNFIGENFRIEYEHEAPRGSHASPHAHWRRGHWRNHRHGPAYSLTKRIFIKPVFVGLSVETGAARPGTPVAQQSSSA